MARNYYKEYALYKGETLVFIGTIKDIAEEIEVKESTLRFLTTPSYRKRMAEKKESKSGRRALVCLGRIEREEA